MAGVVICPDAGHLSGTESQASNQCREQLSLITGRVLAVIEALI
jgi:hypothetical protein